MDARSLVWIHFHLHVRLRHGCQCFFKGECSPHMNSVVRGEIHEIIYAAKGTNKAKINPLSLAFILMSYCTPCACNLRLHERILDVLSYSQV